MFDLNEQGAFWTVGFLVLGLLIAAAALFPCLIRDSLLGTLRAVGGWAFGTPLRAVWRERLVWTACAFLPSALLVAVTAHVSTDIAAAPFLVDRTARAVSVDICDRFPKEAAYFAANGGKSHAAAYYTACFL